jgi:IS5 family transposase
MKQMSLASSGFELKTKRTRKREFLDEMELVVPWSELVALIAPHAPQPGAKGGRPPFAVETMLRIHFLQQWFNLSDPAIEESLYDMELLRQLVRLDSGIERLPDESAILRLRHLLEQHDLSIRIMGAINATLADKGLLLKDGAANAVAGAARMSASVGRACGSPKGQKWPQLRRANRYRCRQISKVCIIASSARVVQTFPRPLPREGYMQAR